MAVLLPCTWGYVDLAIQLARREPPKDQRYADWITQYSDPEFVAAAEWLKKELARVAEGKDETKCARLHELFAKSCQFELDFWEMCWRGEG